MAMSVKLKLAALVCVCLSSIAAGPASAQTAASPAPSAISLPAQDLGDALLATGRFFNRNVLFDTALVRGMRAPAIDKATGFEAALQQLLAGSGLRYSIGIDGSAVITRVGAAASPAGRRGQTLVGGSDVAEIIVTANKKSEKLSSIGAGISAISGDTLERLNANNLEDYLGFVPGVAFTSFGRPGQNQITIRGVAALGLGSSVATYVDEIPVGSASNEAQGSNYTPDIDPADLDHVEVLKGPQGTLYGASSLGGVLKYVTKSPNLSSTDFTTSAEMGSIEHGEIGYKLRAAGSAPIVQDVLGVRLSGFYRRDGGFIDNGLNGRKDVNSDRAWGLRASILYEPTDKLQIKLGAVYQQAKADGLNAVSYNAAPNAPPPFIALHGDLNQWLRLPQPNSVKDQIYTAEVRYDLGFASLVSATGASREDIYRFTDVTGTYTRASYVNALHEPVGSVASLVNNYNIKKVSEEARLQSAANDVFEWVVGGIYQKETSHTGGTVNIRSPEYVLLPQPAGIASLSNSSNDLQEFAGFVNATYYIRPDIDVSVGYRRSHISQANDTVQTGYVFTPANPTAVISRHDRPINDVDTYSAGIRWRITDDALLYVRAASGFRPGGGRPQPPLDIPNFVFTYNPDTVWSYETGIKAKAWGGRAVFDVDVFYIDWTDVQTLVPAVVGQPFLVNGNGGTAVSKGFEGQFQLTPLPGLDLVAGVAYTDAHFTQTVGTVNDGDQLQFVAKFVASLQAEYRHELFQNWDGFIGADYRYRSSMLDAIDFRMPGFGQIGMHVGVERDGTRISAFVINLADKRSLLGYTGGGNQPGDPYRYAVNPPRTIGISVTQKW
ncbi:MAG: TonB-dependent receptor [Rhodospirillales bacterium]|nr:TonB-dependent receptor [Rhodospirillales bacterium]